MLLTALIFFLILSVLVFIHELGHYTVARWVGVKVEEFGFGLPPRIFGKKVKGTVYSLNMLPIGGFVKLAGEDPSEADEQREKAKGKGKAAANVRQFFWARSKKERAAILCAGVAMNFALSVSLTTFLLTHGVIEPTDHVHIEKVMPGSPAERSGIRVGDVVSTIGYGTNGTRKTDPVKTTDFLVNTAKAHAGEPIELTLDRAGERIVVSVIPRKDPPKGEGAMGIAVSNLEKKKYPISQAPVKAISINANRVWQMVSSLGNIVFRLATGAKVKSEEVSGPVGIAQVTGEAVKYGWEAVLEFMSILSLNLAVVNILPFPALDGGRMMFVVMEKFGRKTRPDVERTIHQIGMIVLLALVALITVNDVIRIFNGG